MPRMNEWCHTWLSHVTHEWVMLRMNASCHICMSHVTYEWVMSHMSGISHIIYEWVMWIVKELYHLRIGPILHVRVLSQMGDVTYLWFMSYMIDSRHAWMSHCTSEWEMWYMNESYHKWMSHVYICMQYHTQTHWPTAGAMSAGARTHGDDEFVDFPSTLWASIRTDSGAICVLDSFQCNHTEEAKKRDVYRLQTHSLSGHF